MANINDITERCPFCGKLGSLFVESDEIGWMFVVCETSDNGCGASGPSAITEEEAIEKWNRRFCND